MAIRIGRMVRRQSNEAMGMQILYIDACVRENSRTRRLADAYLQVRLKECGALNEAAPGGMQETVRRIILQEESLLPLNGERLALRERILRDGEDHEILKYAKEFAAADGIVIAAPYWDLSFPALLKEYLENVSAVGITFDYNSQGIPFGKCSAKWLTYVTTVGGAGLPDAFGYEYVKALATLYFGIPEVNLVKAEGLDIVGNDAEAILRAAIEGLSV